MDVRKVAIGGAQLGMDYGVANLTGRMKETEISKIFELAHSMEIHTIDTASQYGDSERLIGRLARKDFNIVTKLPPLPFDVSIIDLKKLIKNQCIESLERLHRDSCEGLLVHNAKDLLGDKGEHVYEALCELKSSDYTKKIGVSVYSPDQVYNLISRFKLDIIQLPLNILDQRFLQNQLLQKLKKSGIELHARSIFLQGLLLMTPHSIPEYFKPIKPLLIDLHKECAKKEISLKQALIEFVTSIEEIDYCIFGVDNSQQFREIIDSFQNIQTICRIPSKKYACNDVCMINPTYWKVHEKS